ncbi:MAG TPA: 4-hydroxybenzoate octaprenyltransferase [Dongiaceae bacterium]|jgi:4-hydroxybenzoate polyprenyltransferase
MNELDSGYSDIRRGNWVDRYLPAYLGPYARLARLDRPIGTWLLLFPGWWAIALAAPAGGWPNFWLLFLFGVGSFVMRGAGCTFNDLVDRNYDRQVARTAGRPIASGEIGIFGAIVFLAIQLLIGLFILLLLRPLAAGLGVASLLLVATYPFMKRITYWPQAFLGLTFNWGALMGYAASTGRIDPAPVALYAAGIAWTMVYDTIYAHQDKEDDALIGVRSTALKFGGRTKPWLALFALAMLALLALTILLGGLGKIAWLAVVCAALHLAWQITFVDIDNPADCLKRFNANRWLGWAIFIAFLAGRFFPG